ncbi:MAG: YfjI family protein [Pseudomonadota bacterium]
MTDVFNPSPSVVPFDPTGQWPSPDLTLLQPQRPPAPIMSDGDFDMVFGPWASWLRNAADAKGAPVDYVMLALLSAAGAAIGNTRWVSPWAGWSEPPIIWAMCVGDPSSGKSPALDAVLDPVRELERDLTEEYKCARSEWDAKDELARLSATAWRAEAKAAIAEGKDAPAKPDSADAGPVPIRARVRISDATTEKVAELISQNWRGLLLSRDELAGWLGGMDRYSNGGDRPFWLESYGGRAFTIDRKANPEPIIIDRLSVAILGGTQPDKLESLLVKSDDDGMLARFAVVYPDPRPVSRPSTDVDGEKVESALRRLRSLNPAVDDAGERRPFFVNLTDGAADVFDQFRTQCQKWEADATGPFKGHIGKLPGMALRMSCILAHLDWAASENAIHVDGISEAHIGRACHLVGEHLRLHAYRAYGTAKPSPEVHGARIIATIIRDDGLSLFKVRDIQNRQRSGLMTAGAIKAALGVLMDADVLREVRTDTGGRRSIDYAVNPKLEVTK